MTTHHTLCALFIGPPCMKHCPPVFLSGHHVGEPRQRCFRHVSLCNGWWPGSECSAHVHFRTPKWIVIRRVGGTPRRWIVIRGVDEKRSQWIAIHRVGKIPSRWNAIHQVSATPSGWIVIRLVQSISGSHGSRTHWRNEIANTFTSALSTQPTPESSKSSRSALSIWINSFIYNVFIARCPSDDVHRLDSEWTSWE